jgi:hypothetical protein
MPDGIHEPTSRTQDPFNLLDQRADLASGQVHAHQHVREHAVRAGVGQRQPTAHVVLHGLDHPGQIPGPGLLIELGQGDGAEVGGGDVETFTGQVQGVAAVPGTELDHTAGTGGAKHPGSMHGRSRGLLAVHSGVRPVSLLPVPMLVAGQLLVLGRHRFPLSQRRVGHHRRIPR